MSPSLFARFNCEFADSSVLIPLCYLLYELALQLFRAFITKDRKGLYNNVMAGLEADVGGQEIIRGGMA